MTDLEKSRLESLQDLVRSNPKNAFARYGLAMELSKYGDPTEAWRHFDYLLAHHPDYVPTYYQAGAFLVAQERREEAISVLRRGIEVAGQQGNQHAVSELQVSLDQLSGNA